MATASNRFLNFSGVQFTPAGGTAIPITEVQNIRLDRGAQLLAASGDADVYNTASTLVSITPRITITSQNISGLLGITPGTHGTLSFTFHDFYNGSGTGALTYTITNCVVGSPDTSAQHRQTATDTLQFEAFSTDGQTSPIAVAIAA